MRSPIRSLITLLLTATASPNAHANPTPTDPAAALAANLRTILLQSLPSPLYEDAKTWGHQAPVERIKWRGKGLKVRPEKQTVLKNDGTWTKVLVKAEALEQTLYVDVRDLRKPEPNRMTFTAIVALNVHVDYDRQKWREGLRGLSAGVQARLRIILALQCEVTSRLEKTTGPLPDLVFRFRVVNSQCHYDNLKVHHIAGIGGEAAEQFGKLFVNAMHQWKPSLERRLLEKANAAIVKAGDTKEVRVGLMGVMRQ